ncbi:MAG: YbaN family protein [Methylobacterium sp.]
MSERPAAGRLARLAYRALGLVFLALAIAGIVLPGLPATPFLLLCVWAFGRGAPAWAARVEAHPHLGPPLRNWRERGVVPKRAKILAIASMAASLAFLWHRSVAPSLLFGLGAVMVGVAVFLLSRPTR